MALLSLGLAPTLAVLGGLIGLYILRVIYLTYTNPIARIPGPEITKWTSWYAQYQLIKGTRPRWIQNLHQIYGPVVRIGPNELDFSDVSAAREIHKVGAGYLKSNWYRKLGYQGSETLFSTTNPRFHAERRRLLSGPISEQNLLKMEPIINQRIYMTIARIEEEIEKTGAADIFKWWTFMATDVIGELSFGESFRMLELGKKTQYITDLQNVSRLMALRSIFPFIEVVVRFLPLPVFKKATEAGARIRNYADQSIKRYKGIIDLNPIDPKPTLFTKLYNPGRDGKEGLTDQEIVREAVGYIAAGSDTTAVTLTYLIFGVCINPEVQKKLVAEVAGLPDNLQHKDVQDLPYLNAVLNETLRLYPATPSPLPRVVPDQGAELSGHNIPGGTIVSSQAYSLHRNEYAFPNPEKFQPERWFNPNREMKDAFLPFGGGSRVCIGMHLAKIEIRMGAALFFKKFPNAHMSTRDGMTLEEMNPLMYFMATPRGMRCLVEGH
ncbi:uncharacterized protein BHQ10_003568 [Talaromyces amestolkiae]|uniref:Cytochrome P450 n=1 Tax=Talaromyces amestolkiae TaxID=1196081 RepID=A0A364KVG9_TALAM|nr:uncharacterized protein BHQ10_003568 [Talaromyces amestolkiae]RAO67556.1 hypothetical protein BHQ10_003568 [Talaromyces amestolkiae]